MMIGLLLVLLLLVEPAKLGDLALVIVLLPFIEFKMLRGRATAIEMPLQGASLLALRRLDRLMGHLRMQLQWN